MSWFTEIAGKAENLLNKIDQNAANALSNSREETPSRKPNVNGEVWNGNGKLNTSIEDNVSHDMTVHTVSETKIASRLDLSNKTKGEVNANGISPSSSAIEQQNGQATRKVPFTTRPKPPRKVPPQQSLKVTDHSAAASVVNGSVTDSKKSDEELLAFLNSPDQREIDESGLLKNELATQAREMGMLLKNHKKLQQEHDNLRRNLDDVQKKAESSETQLDNRLEKSRTDKETLESELKTKNEELNRLRESLDQALSKLQKLDELQNVQYRLEQVELENRKLVLRNDELTQSMSSTSSELQATEKQVQSMKDAISSVENEFVTYKEKAKSILKTKDELIASIKDGHTLDNPDGEATAAESQALAEIASLKNERELLHAEISQSRALAEVLRDEHLRLEAEINTLRLSNNDQRDQISNEKNISHSIQEENLQLSQHISGLQLELERTMIEKGKLEDKYNKLKQDIDHSGRSTTSDISRPFSQNGRQSSNFSSVPYSDNDDSENLRTRITALSQTLLDKQSLINNISADKQLLQIRVERLQAQIQEMSESPESLSNGGLTQAVISSQPLYLTESPWDSRISGRVKRAYGQVDYLCCQFGLAMRQRPNLRLGFCLYILVLHMWVFFILFTWSHHSSVSPDSK